MKIRDEGPDGLVLALQSSGQRVVFLWQILPACLGCRVHRVPAVQLLC